MSHYQFKPNDKRKGRNDYVGQWAETPCRSIELPFTKESLRALLQQGSQEVGTYTHQEIAHWCSGYRFSNNSASLATEEIALNIANDVDAQWEMFLANSFTLAELQQLDFATVRLPREWFLEWSDQLIGKLRADS